MRKRKTCECCHKRLSGDEDYWCSGCRTTITTYYHRAMAQADLMSKARAISYPEEDQQTRAMWVAEELIRRAAAFSR